MVTDFRFVEADTVFNGNLKTYVSQNNGDARDICDYLVDIHYKMNKNVPVYNVDDIEHAGSQSFVKHCTDEWEYSENGSGWMLISVNRLQLCVKKLDPLRTTLSTDFAVFIKAKKVVINPKN
ncbi:hypothetical protein PR048_019993 [Dryococelus australis]|uniref:Uncharacterized protein n=1 Tax=Dryococelus australis TaxID=614101 RepID=A0ABQ9H558_9NEOP|nr:hypothetical protein PR048_019993 [Dryococelus australis]